MESQDIREVYSSLGELKALASQTLQRVSALEDKLEGKVKTLETRITKLERVAYMAIAGILAAGSVGPKLVDAALAGFR